MLWSHCITLSFFYTLYIVITFGVLHMNLPWKTSSLTEENCTHYLSIWCHMCQVPELFYSYFRPISDIHHYNTRQKDCIYISPVKTNLGKMSLKYRGPYVWNMLLQLNINPDSSEASFVKSLKVCILYVCKFLVVARIHVMFHDMCKQHSSIQYAPAPLHPYSEYEIRYQIWSS